MYKTVYPSLWTITIQNEFVMKSWNCALWEALKTSSSQGRTCQSHGKLRELLATSHCDFYFTTVPSFTNDVNRREREAHALVNPPCDNFTCKQNKNSFDRQAALVYIIKRIHYIWFLKCDREIVGHTWRRILPDETPVAGEQRLPIMPFPFARKGCVMCSTQRF